MEYNIPLTTKSPHGDILFDVRNIMVPSMVHKILNETVFDKVSAKLAFLSIITYQRIGIQEMLNNSYSVQLILNCRIDFLQNKYPCILI